MAEGMAGRAARARRFRVRSLFWGCSVGFVLLVLTLGTVGFMRLGVELHDAVYRAVQLFGLSFSVPSGADAQPVPWTLLIARLLAPVVLIAAVIKLMADDVGLRLQRHLNTRTINFPRDVVIGFGPFGQEIGRRLLAQRRAVTWIDRIEGNDADLRQARETAECLGGFLITGDPSDPQRLHEARITRARRVYVALPDELACFDAAEAIRALLPAEKPLRVFTSNPMVANALPSAAKAGFATGRGFELFNLRAEAVRRLVLRAGWDELALLLGQERVHLVIAGCGWQGEALLEETLLLCNRAGLRAPLVTVIDRDAEAVRARLHRRSPALIAGEIGVTDFLAPRFRTADLETIDWAGFDLREEGCEQPPVPVTAWAICTGSDDLNLRAGLELHLAMQTRRLDGAPIHFRLCSGHGTATHTLGTDGITLSRSFGSIEDGLDQTPALECDPDAGSVLLHKAYLEAEALSLAIGSEDQAKPVSDKDARDHWQNLLPSKQASNRRAYRHAPMKLADLGFDWRGRDTGCLPVVGEDDRTPFHKAQEALHDGKFASVPPDASDECAWLFNAMQVEHDRWSIDRALDGWKPAEIRDESRLEHPCMASWEHLDAETRAYDAVLLRALIDRIAPAGSPTAHPVQVICVDVPDDKSFRSSQPADKWMEATELRIRLPAGNIKRPEKTEINLKSQVLQTLVGSIEAAASGAKLCRLTLMFPAPPVPQVLDLANMIAKCAGQETGVKPVWLWQAGQKRARLEGMFEGLPHETS